MSFMFTFLCVINHAKALALEGTLDFHIELIAKKGIVSEGLDKS